MTDLKKGMLVQHATLGLGKVVALEQNVVHVFFADSQDRFATKLRLNVAGPLLSASTATNRWLSGLSTFAFDARAARYRVTDTSVSDTGAVARFLDAYPRGFVDPKYTAGDANPKNARSARWRRAHDVFCDTLGGGEGERLLADGDVEGLVDRACQVARQVRVLLTPAEKPLLADGLADHDAARGYFEALFGVLAQPELDEARFEALASAVAKLSPGGPRELDWSVATLLPFIARPDRHMVLRPNVTRDAVARLRLEVDYRAEPNWATYAALLKESGALLEKLKTLGARDYVDVEVFMHVATKNPSHPKRSAALEPEEATRAVAR